MIPNEEKGVLYTFLCEKRCAGSLTSTARGNQHLASTEARAKALRASYAALRPLRVTAPLRCGSRRLVWPKGSLPARQTRSEDIQEYQMIYT